MEFIAVLEDQCKTLEEDNEIINRWNSNLDRQKMDGELNIFIKKWLQELVNCKSIHCAVFEDKNYKFNLTILIRCETHREIVFDILTK